MEKLKYKNVLDNLLWEKYITEVVKPLTKAYINDRDFEHSHTLLFGNSTYLTRMVARKHIIGDKKYDKLNFTVIDNTYKSFSNPMFIEIDLNLVNQKTIIDVLKPIVRVKSISNRKHRILIHNICYATKNLQFALRKIIESYSENAYIIFTAEKIDSIEVSLKSRLTLINCNVQKNNDLYNLFIKTCRPDIDKNDYNLIIEKIDNDYLNLAIILELEDPIKYEDLLSKFINDSIDRLSKLSKLEYENLLREVSYKISAVCLDIKLLTRIILSRSDITIDKFQKIVDIAVKVDSELNPSNKIFFSLEMYFNRIIQILKN